MGVRRRGKEGWGKWGCPVVERHLRSLQITTTWKHDLREVIVNYFPLQCL